MNGVCLTGDQFIDSIEKVEELRDMYAADVVEMEAFSVLSVAREYDALDRCVVIKSISDKADSSASIDQEANLQLAMENGVLVLDLIL
jgi:adenosylhomocysteine nucleosidase